jgi:steroid 5-alpha reductase family enzyme
MVALIFFSASVILAYMPVWWIIALISKRNDIADVAWGLGFITLAVSLLLYTGVYGFKSFLLVGMVCVWGIRLATHIALRHWGKPEDGRYQKMRDGWKYKHLQSYTHVFLTQGFFLLLVATPIILFFSGQSLSMFWLNSIGLAMWIIGFLFEAISDYQLAVFIKNPENKGKIMKYGLWRYSRHPNYFGEISSWWGVYLFTLFTPFWYVGVIGPITITYLIIGVSGIPMVEKHYEGNAEYEQYQKTTSAFFPLPPRE